ncbi:807_t:CDS:1 [Gigaspora margarita]|uniref:Vacuolar calcium ion transporter n=1 Tax=Gigaspora margarita TaxID=4874 RepID=A0ABN7VEA8_GIGMA|nr:807_t:CDS:1 [Gigaspora margarita]
MTGNSVNPTSPIFSEALKIIIKSSWLNWLLVCFPLGILADFLFHWTGLVTFALNILAIIPLASLLNLATEEICDQKGGSVAGILGAAFGNVVELIISIFMLIHGEIEVVQALMLGSIISNLLLVLGTCMLVGGYSHKIQKFNQTAAQTSSSLMALSCISLLIPVAFNSLFDNNNNNKNSILIPEEILDFFRRTAICLLIAYLLYLFFQLKTHPYLFKEDEIVIEQLLLKIENPLFPLSFFISLLVIVTVCIALTSDCLVSSIEEAAKTLKINKFFVGLIILPIAGNAAEVLI